MKMKLTLKNLTLPELKKEEMVLEMKLLIIKCLIKVPFNKRIAEIEEIKTMVKTHIKK